MNGTQPTIVLALLQGLQEANAKGIMTDEQCAAFLAEKVRDFMRNRATPLTAMASPEEIVIMRRILERLQVIPEDHNGLASHLAKRV